MYRNEPFTDFTVPELKKQFTEGLTVVQQAMTQGSLYACPLIDGKERRRGEAIRSIDPSDPSISLGDVYLGSEQDALDALASVRAGASAWSETSVHTRAEILRRAATLMREDKMRLSAIIVREVGKPWKEADADVAEAIDFCTYYADEAERIAEPRKTQEVPGEDNYYFYQPRGTALVIAPWNFPLAIACGMAVAALVTGNTTILKPAEQSSIIAMELAKILYKAGVPHSAFAFLPGLGEIVGRQLVSHPDIDLICFTGSKSVGLEIIKTASVVQPGQRSIKKVIAELGGKNAIIIDEDADLDEAIKGSLHSAFGFAGQKCSACSRIIIVGSAYEAFLARMKEATKDIIQTIASDPSAYLGPVIDEEAYNRIMKTIDDASREHTILFKGSAPTGGYFVPPTIFRDVRTDSSLWREEIFGPVVACAKVNSFEEGIALANNSIYALTGGVYSRNPEHIEFSKRNFKVGNLYINRSCTGALVCRQPFGGFKMSGVGSKAGGPDYLLQFVEPRTVTENTMRRGFAPE